jgi:hypothetical protein
MKPIFSVFFYIFKVNIIVNFPAPIKVSSIPNLIGANDILEENRKKTVKNKTNKTSRKLIDIFFLNVLFFSIIG